MCVYFSLFTQMLELPASSFLTDISVLLGLLRCKRGLSLFLELVGSTIQIHQIKPANTVQDLQ